MELFNEANELSALILFFFSFCGVRSFFNSLAFFSAMCAFAKIFRKLIRSASAPTKMCALYVPSYGCIVAAQ